jgi:hypothetical protein
VEFGNNFGTVFLRGVTRAVGFQLISDPSIEEGSFPHHSISEFHWVGLMCLGTIESTKNCFPITAFVLITS